MLISLYKKLYMVLGLGLASYLFVQAIPSAPFPATEITNGLIDAKIYLPDKDKGYYQGTRFDWSGVIASLKYEGHEYFGKWFEKYDPKIHDAITGPVEAFDPIGYEEAKPGDLFLKIGVGTLRKIDDQDYRFTAPYQVEDYGNWEIQQKRNQVDFVHEMNEAAGYSYSYRKTLTLVEGQPALIIHHSLKNTGDKKIETRMYNHNFFMFDSLPIGPDYTVRFPFDLEIKRANEQTLALSEIEGKKLKYLKSIQPGESVFYYLEGFGDSPKDYDIRIEQGQTGAGVRITGDKPLSDLAYWSIHTTLCPEPYINIEVEPGKVFEWDIRYDFYVND